MSSLKLEEESMPIIKEITQEIDLSNKTILMIQHWVKDAIDFALSLKNNSKAEVIFLPKPFSQKPEDLEYWEQSWLTIENPWDNYEEWLEKDWYLEEIIESLWDKEIIIVEVWWITTQNLLKKEILEKWSQNKNIKWIVEITTFWHKRHEVNKTNLYIPTYSIARSPIKEREAKHVWAAVYRSLDQVLHELDRAIIDCKITMVWYWMIWQNVCEAFKTCKKVSVYDVDKKKLKKAKNDWYGISKDNIWKSDIIIASTWKRSIDKNFIKKCKDWVLLVSAWSRQNEIDVEYLEENSEDTKEIHKFIKRYTIWWKKIYLFREWKNANFVWNSCPSNSMDLIHAETLYCVKNILDWNFEFKKELNEVSGDDRKSILKMHKKYWN